MTRPPPLARESGTLERSRIVTVLGGAGTPLAVADLVGAAVVRAPRRSRGGALSVRGSDGLAVLDRGGERRPRRSAEGERSAVPVGRVAHCYAVSAGNFCARSPATRRVGAFPPLHDSSTLSRSVSDSDTFMHFPLRLSNLDRKSTRLNSSHL